MISTDRTERCSSWSWDRAELKPTCEQGAGLPIAGGSLRERDVFAHLQDFSRLHFRIRRIFPEIFSRIEGKCISKVKRLAVLLTILSLTIPQAVAFKGLILSQSAKVLSDKRIEKLFKLSNETGGVKEIGTFLGKLNLPNDVLEDTFLRIAFRKGIISREEAIGMFSRLSGVRGFRPALRKMIGNNSPVTKGHLNELKIADEAHQLGLKVRKINEPFSDGMKGGKTDIDIILEKNGKILAIEAKSYKPGTEISMSDFRRDLNTLVAYRSSQPGNVVSIFSMTNKPANPKIFRMLKNETRERNIEFIFGDPRTQALQFEQLGAVL